MSNQTLNPSGAHATINAANRLAKVFAEVDGAMIETWIVEEVPIKVPGKRGGPRGPREKKAPQYVQGVFSPIDDGTWTLVKLFTERGKVNLVARRNNWPAWMSMIIVKGYGKTNDDGDRSPTLTVTHPNGERKLINGTVNTHDKLIMTGARVYFDKLFSAETSDMVALLLGIECPERI